MASLLGLQPDVLISNAIVPSQARLASTVAAIGTKGGGVPTNDSTMEQAIYYVQKHAAEDMAVCKQCEKCFFRRKKRQQYCGKNCANAVTLENRKRWELENRPKKSLR